MSPSKNKFDFECLLLWLVAAASVVVGFLK